MLTTFIPASAQGIYDAWLDSHAHSEMTQAKAVMSEKIGATPPNGRQPRAGKYPARGRKVRYRKRRVAQSSGARSRRCLPPRRNGRAADNSCIVRWHNEFRAPACGNAPAGSDKNCPHGQLKNRPLHTSRCVAELNVGHQKSIRGSNIG
jgi:hypothetical protein